MLLNGNSCHTCLMENQRHQRTADKDAQHRAPRGNARPKQDKGTNGNGDDTRLTDTSGNKTDNHVAKRSVGHCPLTNLSKRSSRRETIGKRIAETEYLVLRHPDSVARHLRRIREKQEHTRGNGRIKDVHTRSAEDFLTKDDREGTGQGQHP